MPAQLLLLDMGFTGPEKTLIDALRLETDPRGNVKADYGKYATNLPGVFAAGAGLPTNVGISSLRIDNSDGWPQVREGGWIALEAKTKGFVPNRLTAAQIALIPTGDLVVGMMVYNITEDCLQINVDGTATGWNCFSEQGCLD